MYQCNCRPFNSKHHQLAFLTQQDPPDVIALQEIYTPIPRLQQYSALTQDPRNRTAIFVLNSHRAQPHQLSQTIPHTFVEVISTHPSQPNVYVLDICNTPPPVVFAPSRRSCMKLQSKQKTTHCSSSVILMPHIRLGDIHAP